MKSIMTMMSLCALILASNFAMANDVNIEVSTSDQNTVKYYNVDFGTQFVNTRTVRAFTITNNGPEKMSLQKAVVWGGEFEAYFDCKDLDVNQKCHMEIHFWPTTDGLKTGELLMRFSSQDMRFRLSGWATK